ncbi:MAG: thiamine pyrophosphate-binding protein [Sedimentisphaerales bacterium]|nr:thiamine pyrophosphate-binding protein [Sedimentisphaerales bacterium]
MKLSDYVFNFVAEIGTQHVFYLPGGGCMHLVDSLGKNNHLQKTCCLHEQAAAIAAEAYSQYTNNLGVALVTTGPGATNAITGVAGAWIDSTPLLIISGQVKRSDMIGASGVRQMGIQEVDIQSIVKSLTKYVVTVTDPDMIKYHLQKAVYLARHGRKGPVWIDLPLDVQGSIIDESTLKEYTPDGTLSEGLSVDEIKNRAILAADMLSQASRPVILAGNGIRLCNEIGQFSDLIHKIKAPVLLTWKASDFLWEEHELYCGKPGIIGQRGANFTQQNADLLISIGARLDLCQIGHNYSNFAHKAKKVIVDIDNNELKKIKTFIDVPVCADAGIFMRELTDAMAKVELHDYSPWLTRCKQWQRKYPVILDEYRQPAEYVNPYYFFDALSDLLKENDLIVPESSGISAEITQQAFRLKKGQRILNTPGLGAMGFGLPACFGACLASIGRRTISIIGDGGLQHNIQELETISRLRLPLKIFILNNNGYASIRNMQRSHFQGNFVGCDPDSGLTLPDTCKIARAYGLETTKIINQNNLYEEISDVLDCEGTMICEVMVNPEVPTAPKMSSQALPDGRMVSKPMEDLWPFLDREELLSNMLIPVAEA